MASQAYDFAIPAGVNQTRVLQAMGTRCKLNSCTGTGITVKTDTGKVFKLKPGQGFKADPGKPFRELFLINPDAAQNLGEIFVGDDDFVDDRVTGDVSIVDNAASKTLAGLQFVGSAARGAAGAGVFSLVGLIAGARRVSIRRITVSSGLAGVVYWGFGSAQPTTGYSNQGSGISKLYAGGITVSNASRWNATAANSPPLAADIPGVQGVGQFMVPANAETVIQDWQQSPLILAAANSVFWLHSAAANRDISATFDFEEL